MAFVENVPDTWKPENPDDIIEGFLINVQNEVGPSKSNLYTLEKDKKPTSVWGSTVLDQRMIGINLGDYIKIKYLGLGEAKPGKNPPKLFAVFVDRDLSHVETSS